MANITGSAYFIGKGKKLSHALISVQVLGGWVHGYHFTAIGDEDRVRLQHLDQIFDLIRNRNYARLMLPVAVLSILTKAETIAMVQKLLMDRSNEAGKEMEKAAAYFRATWTADNSAPENRMLLDVH
jgi:hypothetical protein